jgi:hypothetical protein
MIFFLRKKADKITTVEVINNANYHIYGTETAFTDLICPTEVICSFSHLTKGKNFHRVSSWDSQKTNASVTGGALYTEKIMPLR